MILTDVLAEPISAESTTPVTGTAALPPEIGEPPVVHIPWWAYLRAMANLYWSCLRHPLSETTIDLGTGRVLSRI